jgi:hypothetical protein
MNGRPVKPDQRGRVMSINVEDRDDGETRG